MPYVDGRMSSIETSVDKEQPMRAFARLEEIFQVVDVTPADVPAHFAIAIPRKSLTDTPGFPAAALPQTGRLASGRGWSQEACRLSCLGEAVELVSCCAWGDEELVRATGRQFGPRAISPELLNGFSDDQIRDRGAWNTEYGDFDWRPARHDPSRPIDWIEVEDALGGPSVYVPADFAFIGRRQAGDETAVAIGDSNGCAAGADADSAKLAAVLELIERDATGRWWYGRRQRPTIALSRVEGIRPIAGWLADRARRTWLFDITTDIGVPVAAAASAEADGRDIALGFAARLDMDAAAGAAITEMLQIEISLAAARELGNDGGNRSRWRQAVTMALPPLSAALARPASAGAAASLPGLAGVLDALARKRADLWFVDMTRQAIGLPAFRAVSTTLCHYKPRFARERLLAADASDEGRDDGPAETPTPLLI